MPPWLVVALLGAGALAGLAGLARLAARPRDWDDAEYERRRRARGSGVLAASMKVLGEEIDPGGKRAAEERAALERGGYEESQRTERRPPAGR